MEVYQEFLRRALLGTEYLNSLVDAEQPTDAEISQYYDDNAETYAENRVEKIDKPMVNVRHILIEPEAAEDGTISDEAWAAAEPDRERHPRPVARGRRDRGILRQHGERKLLRPRQQHERRTL